MERKLLQSMLLIVASACCIRWVQATAAEPLTTADAEAIRQVVELQIEAFRTDDARTAFSLASAATRSQIGGSGKFLEIIKAQYPAIYRNRLLVFAAPDEINGEVYQTVRVTDVEDRVWLAVFRMDRTGGRWSIDGCRILETTSTST